MFAHLFVQPFAFTAQHQHGGQGILHMVVIFGAALVQAIDPVAAFLELIQGAIDIGHARHRQMLQRARGGLSHHVGNPRRAPFRDDDPARSGRMGGADDGPQVVRVLDAVEHHHQVGGGDLIECRVLLRGSHGDYSLMGRSARQAVQSGPRFEADGHRSAARQVDDFLQAGSAGALCHQNAIQRMIRPKGLGHGMDTTQNGHRNVSMWGRLKRNLQNSKKPLACARGSEKPR